jgi:ketosteroid isomerase-like protein
LHHCASDASSLHFASAASVFRVKSTGLTRACNWAHAFTVRDGKIAGFREYTDTTAMASAFGGG